MSRLLDEYTLQENIKQNSYVIKTDTGYDVGMALGTILRTIYKTPSVKNSQQIQCRECKWYRTGSYSQEYKFCFRLLNDNREPVGYYFSPDGFCSYAEKEQNKEVKYDNV